METVILLYASVVLGLVAASVFLLNRTFILRRTLTCPESKQRVRTQIVCRGSLLDVTPLRVKSCSAFKRPRKIECDQKCLGLLSNEAMRSRKPLTVR